MFLVFGRADCGYCIKAKQLLESQKAAYKFYDLTTVEGKTAYEPYRYKVPAVHKTVPIVFCNSIFIGGYTELSKCF
jgi:glutaredoxin 1